MSKERFLSSFLILTNVDTKPSPKLIHCDGCDEWFHKECVDLPVDGGEILFAYFCPDCEEDNSDSDEGTSLGKGHDRMEDVEMTDRPKKLKV